MGDYVGKHPVRGIVAGAVGGLAAAWVMNQFITSAGPRLQGAIQTKAENATMQQEQEKARQNPQPDATMKAADAIVSTVTGGEHLSWEAEQKGGPIVHYSFGVLMGALYGGLAEFSPAVRSGFGTTFGTLLFIGGDLLAVPALNLSGSAADAPVTSYATPLAAHLIYGAATEVIRHVVRRLV